MSSVLPAFNQTVTELLPARKPVPQKTDRPEGFDRELKEAGKRLDKSQPSDDRPRTATQPEKPATTEAATESEAVKEPKRNDKPAVDAQPGDEQSAPANETASDVTTGDSKPTPEAQPGQAQPTNEAAAVATTNQQLVEQVQVVTGSEPAVQTAQATNTQATQAVVDPSQVVAATQSSAGQATPEQTTNQAIQTVAQPRQVKQAQTQEVQSIAQAEPSAAAQRIAQVAESHQQDAGASTADDSGKQQQGALKADSGAQLTANSAVSATSTTTSTAPTTQVAAGVQTVVSADSPAQVATNAAPAGPSIQAQDTDNTQLNTARIARGMQNAVQQKGGAVTLRLTPPEMGTVRIQLQIQNGTVNAQFHAETESTRTMLHQQLSQLRTALEHQGLNVERLGVHTMQQSHSSSAQQEFQQNERDGQSNDGRSRGGFTQQGNRQSQRQSGGEPQQSAFEQQMSHAA